jgi:DNA-binding NtrC family response regulator
VSSTVRRRKRSILIVEDEGSQLGRYLELARSAELDAHGAMTQEDAMQMLSKRSFQFLLTDIHLGGAKQQGNFEGLNILQHVKSNMPEIIPLAMTADPKIETYERVLNEGVLHLFRKPIVDIDELLIHLDAAQSVRLTGAMARRRPADMGLPPHLRKVCADGVVFPDHIRDAARKIAAHGRVPVVIFGETGTGKEEVAKIIHRRRVEAEGAVPLIAVNCAHLAGDTMLSMLFGHKKGAFTGADQTTNGFIGDANGGILFLDEIQTLTIECQQRLLRVLNDGSYTRLGDTQTLYSEFQVVVASTRDLDDEVEAGRFLLDLRTRLIGIDIHLDPLRERKQDLAVLVELFFVRQGLSLPKLELEQIARRCAEFHWRGNVRQLFQVLQVLLVQADGSEDRIRAEYLPVLRTMLTPGNEVQPTRRVQVAGLPEEAREAIERALKVDQALQDSVTMFERFVIGAAISRHAKIQDVANGLKIGRSTLDEKRKKYGL